MEEFYKSEIRDGKEMDEFGSWESDKWKRLRDSLI